jgi:hypothetical protein
MEGWMPKKRFDPADSHQQDSAIVEGPEGNDCMIKKLNKNKELTSRQVSH